MYYICCKLEINSLSLYMCANPLIRWMFNSISFIICLNKMLNSRHSQLNGTDHNIGGGVDIGNGDSSAKMTD